MTLQNDPPSLESVSEYEDQYKHYGKSIRKLIVDCLQKDPTKRPTASELLKYPFLKKAKDRRYLMQTLLPSTPSFAECSRRALDAKRGSYLDSGNNGESGGWVWPPEDGHNQIVGPQSNNIYTTKPEVVGSSVSELNDGDSQSSSGSPSSITDGITSSAKSNDTFEDSIDESTHQVDQQQQDPKKDQQVVVQHSKSFDESNDNQL